MTLNVWNYTRPWQVRRHAIAALISAYAPDVVALQETRHDARFERGKGQGEQLAELSGYHSTFALGQVYVPLPRIDEGLTTLTRETPITTWARVLTPYPRERSDETRRVCLGVRIPWEDCEVDVYNTHFSLSPVARTGNAADVAALMRSYSADRPAILMGDLNDVPDSPPLRVLAESGLSDVWEAAGSGPGLTYPSGGPVRRIDYILTKGVCLVLAETVGGDPADGAYPSDHLGVLAEVTPESVR